MNKMDLAAIFMILVAVLIQGWLSIVRLATDNITSVSLFMFSASIVLLITGTVLYVSSNIHSLFATYHRINYLFSIVSLVGLILLVIFRISLENLLFPKTMIIYFLIIDLFWMLFLGLLLDNFRKASTTN